MKKESLMSLYKSCCQTGKPWQRDFDWREAHFAVSFYEELDWKKGSYKSKDEHRKGVSHWIKRGLINDGEEPLQEHPFDTLVNVGILIRSILRTIQKLNRPVACLEERDVFLFRLEALLYVEKEYIYESFQPTRHIPKIPFVEIIKTLQKTLTDVRLNQQLEQLVAVYPSMYDIWEQKYRRVILQRFAYTENS